MHPSQIKGYLGFYKIEGNLTRLSKILRKFQGQVKKVSGPWDSGRRSTQKSRSPWLQTTIYANSDASFSPFQRGVLGADNQIKNWSKFQNLPIPSDIYVKNGWLYDYITSIFQDRHISLLLYEYFSKRSSFLISGTLYLPQVLTIHYLLACNMYTYFVVHNTTLVILILIPSNKISHSFPKRTN